MRQFGLGVNEAMSWACERHYAIQDEFCALMENVPFWNHKVNEELNEYVLSLAHWPRASVCWIFECRRYYGDLGQKVMETRKVPMLPKTHESCK